MKDNTNLKLAAHNFLSLFKLKKNILIIAILASILSIIVSIIIPLRTGIVIDSIIDNINIKKNNAEAKKIIDDFIPLIKDLENINFEALYSISKNLTIEDLINYGLVNNESIELLDKETKTKLLSTKANLYENINCYECNENKDYIEKVNDIYKILNIKKTISFNDTKTNFIIKNIIIIFILILMEFILYYITNFSMSKLSKEITKDLRKKNK